MRWWGCCFCRWKACVSLEEGEKRGGSLCECVSRERGGRSEPTR